MSKSDTAPLVAQHPVATILRSRGFVPLPRLWVRSDDMPTIHEIADQYRDEVNTVRAEVRAASEEGLSTARQQVVKSLSDPKTDKDAAWEAAERLRGTG